MFKKVFSLLILTLIFSLQAHAEVQECIDLLNEPSPSKREVFRPQEYEFESYMEKPFYNGAFLLEFFGPTKNTFRDWLKWLESDDKDAPAPPSPGLYFGSSGLSFLKKSVYPIDAGISEFRDDIASSRMHTSVMEIRTRELSNMRGSSQSAVKARAHFLKLLDTYIFGLSGALKEDSYENLVMRTAIGGDHTLNLSIRPGMRYRVKDRLSFGLHVPDFKPPPTPLDDFKKVAQVIHETDHAVTVKVKLGRKEGEILSQNEELIQRMFFMTHWQMVQKAYRETGLFKDELKTAIYLLDDFVKSMEHSGGEQEIYLMYEREAWESMEFRMGLAHRYVAIEMFGAGLQPYQYQRISDVFYPFYPRYGLAVEKHPTGELEFKRLFHNEDSDPLHMLSQFVEEKDLSKDFYYHVTQQLEPGAKVMAVSKTPMHTRFYRQLGFKLENSVFNPEWGTNKDTLMQTRESFLEKLKPKPEQTGN